MTVVHPTYGPAVQSVYGTGTVEATVMLPIASRATARLVALDADEGQSVTKGQVLGRLDDDDLQNNLRALEAQAKAAEDDYARKDELFRKGFETKANIIKAQSARDAARAAVGRARAELDFLKLTAPADGLVIKRDGEVGQLIPANQPVFWLSCCAPLRISAEIDEEDVHDVTAGQTVLIRADAFPGKIFHGRVQSLTPKGDPVSRSYRARISFTEETPLQIGMTAEANIIVREAEKALLIPNSALSADNKVWLVKDGRAAPKTVETGARGAELTEVRGGLEEKDTLILKPGADLKSGQALRTSRAQGQ